MAVQAKSTVSTIFSVRVSVRLRVWVKHYYIVVSHHNSVVHKLTRPTLYHHTLHCSISPVVTSNKNLAIHLFELSKLASRYLPITQNDRNAITVPHGILLNGSGKLYKV